jgi:hypothetical protein
MKKRSVLTRVLMVVTLATCLPLGGPSLRLLSALEGETSQSRAEVEHNDHAVLCASSPRRVRALGSRFSIEQRAQAWLKTIASRHHAVAALPPQTPSPDAWSVPLRC